MLNLINGIRSIIETCMEIKPGECVLIVADSECEPMWIGQIAMEVVNSMGAEAVLAVMAPREIAGHEPPAPIATAWKSVNAVLQISNRQGLAHTNARKEATAAGIRYYSMIQVPVDELKQGASAPDIRAIKERTETLARMLTLANRVRVTNPPGTNIAMELSGREGLALHPMSHAVASIPAYGEAAIAPVEGSAQGIIVVDLAPVGWGYLLREPLRLIVQAGKVVNVSGHNEDVDRLRKVAAADENASNIAELGIGTSHIMPVAMHGSRRDAARLGTVHIAIGRNNDIGGKTWSRIHLDFLMSQPTIELDGQLVVREGKFLI